MSVMISISGNNKMGKSIYRQTRLSRVNHRVIAAYQIFFLVSMVLFGLTLFLEFAQICEWWRKWNIESWQGTIGYQVATIVREKYLFLQNYIICNLEKETINLFSIIISLLSVMAAVFSITFGNFKICSINANLVLKQIYGGGKKKISTKIIVLMMVTPFVLLGTIVFQRYVIFAVSFLIAFCNLFYLLDICLTIFTDNGVKYVIIPDNISRELRQSVKLSRNLENSSEIERERLLYDSFVQNIMCDDYSVNRVVVPSVVLRLTESECHNDDIQIYTKDSDTKYTIYQKTYRFFFDIRKYLFRNTTDKKDYLNTYFSLCSDTIYALLSQYLKDTEKSNCFGNVCMAIFRNVVETLCMNESEEYHQAFDVGLTELLKNLSAYLKKSDNDQNNSHIKQDAAIIVLSIVFQLEYELKVLISSHIDSVKAYKNISNTVRYLFDEVYNYFSSKIRRFGKIEPTGVEEVEEVIRKAKKLFIQLSFGDRENGFIYQLDIKTASYCADCIVHDLYLYVKFDSEQLPKTSYLNSAFVFIYEAYLKGHNK